MTLRQVLSIIWQRWMLVLSTTVLIGAATAAYAAMTPQVYESTTILRYSADATRIFDGGSGHGGVEFDLDTFFVTSEEVLEIAVEESGESISVLREATSVRLLEGVRTNRLQVTSEADSPESAQERANAVAHAYTAYLQSQLDAGIAELELELEVAEQERDEAIEAVLQDPNAPLIQDQAREALSNHSDLTSRLSSIESAGPPVRVMQGAHPGRRLGTEEPILIFIGIITGLIAGVGVALIREQFDDRMRSAQVMQEVTEQPLLAEVMLIRQRRGDISLPLAGNAPTPFNESIRSLRTALQVAYPGDHTVITVTSPAPGDGKTFLTANLAVSMARSGRRVLLVGGDLRRPRLGSYFGVETDQEGFAEVLQSDASAEQIEERLLPTQFDGLRLLSAGVARRQPADLLAGDTLPRVLDRMRGLAEVVLIDTPPGLAIADATLLGTKADGVVVVSSLKTTSKRDLLSTLNTLEVSGAPIAGIVANRSRRATDRRYSVYYKVADDAQA